MTENGLENRWGSEDPLEELASDLWGVTKAISAMSDEEELRAWEQAVAVLHDFGKVAETLRNDPLLLALTDAKVRAEEELARVRDRLNRPEGEDLHPRERERLAEMQRDYDALNDAYWTIDERDEAGIKGKADTLEVLAALEWLRGEAEHQLERYRREIGLV